MKQTDGAAANSLPNGYTMLPKGKLANAVTYLEVTSPPPGAGTLVAPPGVRLEPLQGTDAGRYRHLYRAIGEPWLWAGHLGKSEAQLASMLDAPARETWALRGPRGDIGVLQLEYAGTQSAEVVYFGLVPDAIGAGLGRWLMAQAIHKAFAKPVQRLWLHTCNFDHPNAVRFYQRAGFKIYAAGFEIMDDPRLDGRLPLQAAPHVPLVP